MDLLENLRRQLTYNYWANKEVCVALASDKSTRRSRELLAHILSAERLWLERIQQRRQSLPVWPDFSLEKCSREMEEIHNLWQNYFAQLPSAALQEIVSYANSKGEKWTNTVQDILTHMLLHSAYHRGQIASEMRRNGEQPAYTDFIHAARKGLLE